KIISIAFERPWYAERNVCKSVLGLGTVNFPFTLNRGIKRIKPSGLHNNSDCSDKLAALERDEADTATARTTVLIEKVNITEILRIGASAMMTKAIVGGSEQLRQPLCQATTSILGPVVHEAAFCIAFDHRLIEGVHIAVRCVLCTGTGRPSDVPIPLCLCKTPASTIPRSGSIAGGNGSRLPVRLQAARI